MNIKKQIFAYAPQPIIHPWKALAFILMCSVLVFMIGSLLAWQGILFQSFETSWRYLLVSSPFLVIALFGDKAQRLKFPVLLQKYLINPKLAMDLKEQALRSSDAIILDYRHIRAHWWQGKQQQLLLKLHEHEDAKWFNIDLNQVFNNTVFLTSLHVKLNQAIIGQHIWVHYLARSRTIVQLYAQDHFDDFHQMKDYFSMPYTGHLVFHQIPTQLMLDIPYLSEIQAIREQDQKGYLLKLKTSYGKTYSISSLARHFDKLELALSGLIDFIAYRNFKQHPEIQQARISKQHPKRIPRLLLGLTIFGTLVAAILFQDWIFFYLGFVLIYLLIRNIRHYKTSPFIEDADLHPI